jgi:outer membrane protein assembly factor BamB
MRVSAPYPIATFLALTAGLLLAASAPALAQLAPTPWPMLQHDLQRTGRSHQLGPLFPSGAPGPENVRTWQSPAKITSAPTIAADGTIYVAIDVPRPGTSGLGYQYALNPDLSVRWIKQFRADSSQSSAAVGADGTVYVGDRDNSMNALDPATGVLRWLYNHGFEGDIHTSPAIGQDGTIYFAFSQNFYGAGVVTALRPDGSLKWKYVLGKFVDASSPALDQAGALYIGDVGGAVHKFVDGGTLATRPWKVQVGTKIVASPVIGADGTIYVGSTNGLSALRPTNGQLLWNFNAGPIEQTPAIGKDGTIYFGVKSGQYRTIYAVSSDGLLRWQYGPVIVSSSYGGFPSVGADGVVYVGFGTTVRAFSPDGVSLWIHDTGAVVTSWPTIAGSATKETGGTAVLYVTTVDGRLLAISGQRHGVDTNEPPTANAGPDQEATVGQVVQLNGSAGDGNADVLSFSWIFGVGKTAIGATAHHAYVSPGTYTATLSVSDGLATSVDTASVVVTAPASQLPPFSDGFDRADAPSLGNGWVEAQGDLVIKTNEARNAPLKDTHIAIQPTLSGLTHAAAASFASVDNNVSPRLGLVLRFIDPQTYYVLYRQMGGSSQLRISKIVGGIETVLASAGTPQPAVNTVFRLTADATTNKLTLKLCAANEPLTGLACAKVQQTLTVTDSALAGGSVGVLIGTGTGATQQYRVDKFAAEVK